MVLLKDLFPQQLHTSRLTLELFDRSPQAYTCLLAAMNSPTAHARMGDYGIRTPAQFDEMNGMARLFDPKFQNGGIADGDCYYVLRLNSGDGGSGEGPLIGGVSLMQRHVAVAGRDRLPPDVGWCVLEDYMGKGYASEAARELLRFVREGLGWSEVICFRAEGNEASNRVAEKVGFVDGGECPDLDRPGSRLRIFILPGMKCLDEMLKDGLGFKLR